MFYGRLTCWSVSSQFFCFFVTWSSKRLAKRTRTESTQVNAIKFSTCVFFGHPLVLTCIDFGHSYTSRRKFSPFGYPAQVDTSWSQANCISVKFMTFCDLRADLRIRLATHSKCVRKFWFANLRRFESKHECNQLFLFFVLFFSFGMWAYTDLLHSRAAIFVQSRHIGIN